MGIRHTPSSRPNLRFGAFEMNFEAGELRKCGTRIRLQDQPFQLLSTLVERAGQVVTRDELRQRVWPADTFVDFDASLNIAVMKIRQALGDSAADPRFVETVPRRGYRFVAPVDSIAKAPVLGAASEAAASPGHTLAVPASPGRILILLSLLTIPLVATWVVLSRPHQSETLAQAWTTRPLTHFLGQELSPTWSPDATRIAFVRRSGRDANIFTMPMVGGHAVQLTHGAADNLSPRWSPDGRYIAYLAGEGTTERVALVPAGGGAPRMIADTNLPHLESDLESSQSLGAEPWSPDGQKFVFSRLQPDGRIGLWKLDLSTNQQNPLTSPPPDSDDLLSAWSFDGHSVAFTRRQAGVGSLWLVRVNGGDPRPLLKDRFDNSNPAWSRDNRRIVFESNRGGAQNLWELDVGSRHARQMTTGVGADVNPVVGPQNGLMYVRLIQEVTLFGLGIYTGQEDRLTSNTGEAYWPRFSPDGRKVVYQSNQTGNWELWILDVKTKEEIPLTHHPGADIAPEWSPDGRFVSFLSDRSGPFQIWLLDIQSGKASRLLPQPVLAPASINYGHGGQIPAHRWSPDGNNIGFLTRDEQKTALWSVDRNGKNPKRLISGVLAFDWYRDSNHLLYTRVAADASDLREVVLLDLISGHHEVILRGPYVDVEAAKTGDAILFASGASHFNQDLFMVPLSRSAQAFAHTPGEPTQLTHGNGIWHVHNGTWSPDGKSIAYSRDRAEADIYLIENYR